ncbi:MAG: tetratricopeptide repeat protein [Nanoarchaeota archaeon]|nr:tetratricopeptide repeat protein [Nanoarchaeota archaeon]
MLIELLKRFFIILTITLTLLILKKPIKKILKHSTTKKIGVLFFSIILTIAILEFGIRAGGLAFLFAQNSQNQITGYTTFTEQKEYRILCLGESTTAGIRNSWPQQLEITLNNKSEKIKFKIFNEGIPGTNTGLIISTLEENLEKYSPNMVISMMGINDIGISFYETQTKNTFLEQLKIFDLAKIMIKNLENKIEQEKIIKYVENIKTEEELLKKIIELDENNDWLHAQLAYKYYNQNQTRLFNEYFENAFRINLVRHESVYNGLRKNQNQIEIIYLLSAIEQYKNKNPEKEWVYTGLGILYYSTGQFKEAQNAFKKIIEINPQNELALMGMGKIFYEMNLSNEAEKMFNQVKKINPKNVWTLVELEKIYTDNITKFKQITNEFLNYSTDWAYAWLGRVYYDFGIINKDSNYITKSKNMFEKAINANPNNDWVYILLRYYHSSSKEESEKLLKKAIEINSKNDLGYYELALLYQELERVNDAEKMLLKAIDLVKDEHMLYDSLGRIYFSENKPTEYIETFFAENGFNIKIMRSLTKESNTKENYLILNKKLKEKEITNVAMQYPLRDVEKLKEMLNYNEDIIFVSNKENFEKTLETRKYSDLFWDTFAWHLGYEFGHCTLEGNRLIAENVANTILKKLNITN